MQRFFVSPAALRQWPVALTGDQAHQVRRVLRLRPGDRVMLLDGLGAAYEAALIALNDRAAHFQLVLQHSLGGESGVHITLHQAVLKGERFAWALQKGTEIGISRFVPLICERNVVDDLTAVAAKRERWERIIQEAAEQSGRGRLPVLTPPQRFPEVVREPAGESVRLIPWEGEHSLRLSDALADCNLAIGGRIELFVGPEGGFTEAEIEQAKSCGVQPVTLGPRILRAETAGLVAASAILYQAGEF